LVPLVAAREGVPGAISSGSAEVWPCRCLFRRRARRLQFGSSLALATSPGFADLRFRCAVSSGKTEFARGYLSGSGYSNALNGPRLVELLDATEDEHPETAFSLSHAAQRSRTLLDECSGWSRRETTACKAAKLYRLDRTRKRRTRMSSALSTLLCRWSRQRAGYADLAVEFVAYQYYRTPIPTGEHRKRVVRRTRLAGSRSCDSG